jgi:hypothetical protein
LEIKSRELGNGLKIGGHLPRAAFLDPAERVIGDASQHLAPPLPPCETPERFRPAKQPHPCTLSSDADASTVPDGETVRLRRDRGSSGIGKQPYRRRSFTDSNSVGDRAGGFSWIAGDGSEGDRQNCACDKDCDRSVAVSVGKRPKEASESVPVVTTFTLHCEVDGIESRKRQCLPFEWRSFRLNQEKNRRES